ncbi:MAG: hypothetical protein QGI75_02460 [Phycisphaerales bacterium]|jgi:hypothetical protein|nr:hypothetical protein [Phycisphaerales bacterium]
MFTTTYCLLFTLAGDPSHTVGDHPDWMSARRSEATAALVRTTLSKATPDANTPQHVDWRTALSLGALQEPEDAPTTTMSSEALAKELANPVASLISVPFQWNYDRHIGPDDDGTRHLLNFQPVIPISLSDDWNLISRTIVPLAYQRDITPRGGNQRGVGDILQSLFFSPKKPTENGWILGAGPVLLLPTASNDLLGGEQWAAGPTFVGLRQTGPWTYGALANHVWSFAGARDRDSINSTFLQPFVSYTTPDAWTFTLETESTYDWRSSEWSVPIIGVVSKVLTIGDQRINIFGGIKYWAQSPTSGPSGFGLRFGVTLLFPN